VKSYAGTARSLQYGKTGSNNYFIDETGVIRMMQGDLLAAAQGPMLE